MAETGRFEEKVRVPLKDFGPLKGASFRNRASWPCGGRVRLPVPLSVPLESVKKKETVACESFGLATAKPVFADVPISASIRPLKIGTEAGTPASDTIAPFCR